MQNAYLLAFGGLLLPGRGRMFVIGSGLFTLASLGVGSAQSEAWLIAARAAAPAPAADAASAARVR